ncbi:hypothetical protein F5X68DRAFT_245023 [Plectosphaerella plurivora]|uniref:Uncharacterized protein n=1 Tax=Plectosphaerella plurivora TaxID=936078 RepID=A0A9P8V868_9PEZI|nr:hypothetical protein F5X68DRAFT_245023 [Plectosphaerella plurivora]
MSWAVLPAELRLMIFHYFKREHSSPEDTIHPPFDQLAPHRLDAFEEYVGSSKARQLFVERIFLRIRLPEYDCNVCKKTEDAPTAQTNDSIFILALKKFMRIMSEWELLHNGQPRRLIELDLGAYSPSDGLHGIRDARFAPGYYLGTPSNERTYVGVIFARHGCD